MQYPIETLITFFKEIREKIIIKFKWEQKTQEILNTQKKNSIHILNYTSF